MKQKKRWTEKRVQKILAKHFMIDKNHLFTLPNCLLFGWEMDIISITNSMLCHEVEIKVNRGDFLCDHKKRKHRIINNEIKWLCGLRIPNYFWYAALKGICCREEAPDYAGMMLIDNSNEPVKIIKKAPRISRRKLSEAEVVKMAHLLSFRLWFHKAKMTVLNSGDTDVDS